VAGDAHAGYPFTNSTSNGDYTLCVEDVGRMPHPAPDTDALVLSKSPFAM